MPAFNFIPDVDQNTERYVGRVTDSHNTGIKGITGGAQTGTRGLEKEQLGTDKSTLDPNANKNIAKGESQYGMYNNKDYSTTLRLARQADAYNNAPRARYMAFGPNGPVDLGMLDKPQLNTMETRAMDQALQLDTNQKQLAQSLQDAVNHKDLEAFQMLYKQLYGIELDSMQAQMEMLRYTNQLRVQQMFMKDAAKWQNYFTRAFGAETATVLYNMVSSQPQLAVMISQQLNGTLPPSQKDRFEEQFIQEYIQNSDLPPQQARMEAERALSQMESRNDTLIEIDTKKNSNSKTKRQAKKYQKGKLSEEEWYGTSGGNT